MTPLDSICQQLDLMTKGVLARLLSRIAMNGILYVPNTISEVIAAGDPSKDAKAFNGDKIIARLVAAYMHNMKEHDVSVATMPFILRGPPDAGSQILFIRNEQEIAEVELKLRDEATMRLLRGLDVSATSVEGNGDSNHWSAWADRDDELRARITPDLELMSFALDVLLIDPTARALGVRESDINGSKCCFDLSGATARPNLAEDARQGRDRKAVGQRGVRATAGIPEEYAPTPDELIRMAGEAAKNPYLELWKVPGAENIDWELYAKVAGKAQPGPDPDSPGEDPSVGPGVGDPGAPGKGDSDAPKSKTPA